MGLLDAKVGIVTGAAQGIGRGTALLFAREGAKVTVADVDLEGGEQTAAMIRQAGGEAIFVRADVTSAADVAAMVERTVEAFGGLHCASNNAALGVGYALTVDVEEEAWQRTLDVTLTGVWRCLKVQIPAMLASGGGSIVNISSDSGIKGEAFMSAYSAAKGGVLALTKSVAAEYAARGVRVNAVCPGGIWTPSLAGYLERDAALAERTRDTHAMKRFGTVDEVAEAVVWLCSDRSSFTTGHSLLVDGGVLVKSHAL
jgi:NAD(P)-dependent dehydrogenase (short-subunit alcohol dehydrogenase family)